MNQDPLTPYQRRLVIFLSVASFFEGYDFIALTQILPNFRASMGVGKDVAGQLVTLVNLGTVIAYFVVRGADRWGRRRVLTVTIAGYAAMSFLSGLAPTVWTFGLCQMVARIFLIGEYVTSMVVAAEEFPSSRRGSVVGTIAAFSSLGAIVCAGLVPVLLKLPWGWRSVYFVGIVPLSILAYARRGLKETRRFSEIAETGGVKPFFHIWRTPHRRRVLQLGAIWFAASIAAQNGVTFWKDFAVTERGLTDADVGIAIPVAALVAMPLVFLVGRVMDSWGRRPTAAVVFSLGAVGTWGCYTLEGKWPLTAALMLGVFASSAFLPVLNAMTTELFPTDIRANGFAWSNNLIGRVGSVASPFVIGHLASTYGWGPVIRSTAVFPLITILLIYWLLPETKRRSLEETAAI